MQFAYNLAIIHESPKIFVKFCKNLYICAEISKKNIRFSSVCKLHVTKISSIPIIYRAALKCNFSAFFLLIPKNSITFVHY